MEAEKFVKIDSGSKRCRSQEGQTADPQPAATRPATPAHSQPGPVAEPSPHSIPECHRVKPWPSPPAWGLPQPLPSLGTADRLAFSFPGHCDIGGPRLSPRPQGQARKLGWQQVGKGLLPCGVLVPPGPTHQPRRPPKHSPKGSHGSNPARWTGTSCGSPRWGDWPVRGTDVGGPQVATVVRVPAHTCTHTVIHMGKHAPHEYKCTGKPAPGPPHTSTHPCHTGLPMASPLEPHTDSKIN